MFQIKRVYDVIPSSMVSNIETIYIYFRFFNSSKENADTTQEADVGKISLENKYFQYQLQLHDS